MSKQEDLAFPPGYLMQAYVEELQTADRGAAETQASGYASLAKLAADIFHLSYLSGFHLMEDNKLLRKSVMTGRGFGALPRGQ